MFLLHSSGLPILYHALNYLLNYIHRKSYNYFLSMLLSNAVYKHGIFFCYINLKILEKLVLNEASLFGVVRCKSISWSSGHRRREFNKNTLNQTPLVNNVKK